MRRTIVDHHGRDDQRAVHLIVLAGAANATFARRAAFVGSALSTAGDVARRTTFAPRAAAAAGARSERAAITNRPGGTSSAAGGCVVPSAAVPAPAAPPSGRSTRGLLDLSDEPHACDTSTTATPKSPSPNKGFPKHSVGRASARLNRLNHLRELRFQRNCKSYKCRDKRASARRGCARGRPRC